MSITCILRRTSKEEVPSKPITRTLRAVLNTYSGITLAFIARYHGIRITSVLAFTSTPTLFTHVTCFVLTFTVLPSIRPLRQATSPFPPRIITFRSGTFSFRKRRKFYHILAKTFSLLLIQFRYKTFLFRTVGCLEICRICTNMNITKLTSWTLTYILLTVQLTCLSVRRFVLETILIRLYEGRRIVVFVTIRSTSRPVTL